MPDISAYKTYYDAYLASDAKPYADTAVAYGDASYTYYGFAHMLHSLLDMYEAVKESADPTQPELDYFDLAADYAAAMLANATGVDTSGNYYWTGVNEGYNATLLPLGTGAKVVKEGGLTPTYRIHDDYHGTGYLEKWWIKITDGSAYRWLKVTEIDEGGYINAIADAGHGSGTVADGTYDVVPGIANLLEDFQTGTQLARMAAMIANNDDLSGTYATLGTALKVFVRDSIIGKWCVSNTGGLSEYTPWTSWTEFDNFSRILGDKPTMLLDILTRLRMVEVPMYYKGSGSPGENYDYWQDAFVGSFRQHFTDYGTDAMLWDYDAVRGSGCTATKGSGDATENWSIGVGNGGTGYSDNEWLYVTDGLGHYMWLTITVADGVVTGVTPSNYYSGTVAAGTYATTSTNPWDIGDGTQDAEHGARIAWCVEALYDLGNTDFSADDRRKLGNLVGNHLWNGVYQGTGDGPQFYNMMDGSNRNPAKTESKYLIDWYQGIGFAEGWSCLGRFSSSAQRATLQAYAALRAGNTNMSISRISDWEFSHLQLVSSLCRNVMLSERSSTAVIASINMRNQ